MYTSLWTSFNSCISYFHICATLSKYRGEFNGIYIVLLLLYLQNRLFKMQRKRLLCFLSNYVYQPNHLIKKVPYCEFAKTVTPLNNNYMYGLYMPKTSMRPLDSQLRQLPWSTWVIKYIFRNWPKHPCSNHQPVFFINCFCARNVQINWAHWCNRVFNKIIYN